MKSGTAIHPKPRKRESSLALGVGNSLAMKAVVQQGLPLTGKN
jgi:hypothetical protein